jgi:5,10-methylenetetrahydromethanopterin reductase
MRLGISLNDHMSGTPDDVATALRQAADDGFPSAWLADSRGLDAMAALAVAGGRVPAIEVGTAVVPVHLRHPVAMAQGALTTDLATGGRFALGIGLSHRPVVEDMYHIPFDRPARYMEEYLSVLLPLLREGAASFTGEVLGGDTPIALRPAGPLPVLLAALAPRMLRLAGTVADGTILWMTGPKTIGTHIVPRITEAAEAAGRPSPRVVSPPPVCVTDDEGATRTKASEAFARYGTLPSYRAMLDKEGASAPGDVLLAGDEESVRQQIEAQATVGVTDFVAVEFGEVDDVARTRAMLASLAASTPA